MSAVSTLESPEAFAAKLGGHIVDSLTQRQRPADAKAEALRLIEARDNAVRAALIAEIDQRAHYLAGQPSGTVQGHFYGEAMRDLLDRYTSPPPVEAGVGVPGIPDGSNPTDFEFPLDEMQSLHDWADQLQLSFDRERGLRLLSQLAVKLGVKP